MSVMSKFMRKFNAKQLRALLIAGLAAIFAGGTLAVTAPYAHAQGEPKKDTKKDTKKAPKPAPKPKAKAKAKPEPEPKKDE
jgi:hypothetical protein